MKSILITGCSSGIGLDAALAFRDAGWLVIASCRKEADCETMRGTHGMQSVRIDYEDEASIPSGFVATLEITGGQLDVLFNNGAYGNVRRDQMTRFDGRVIASDLPKIDYLQLAEAQGVAGERVNSPAALQTALKSAIDADAPRLIEVLVDRSEEVSPWPFIVPNRA